MNLVFHVDEEKHETSRQFLLHLLMPDHPNEGRLVLLYFILFTRFSLALFSPFSLTHFLMESFS